MTLTMITHAYCCRSRENVNGTKVYQREAPWHHVAITVDVIAGVAMVGIGIGLKSVALSILGTFQMWPVFAVLTLDCLNYKERNGNKDIYIKFTKCSCCRSQGD